MTSQYRETALGELKQLYTLRNEAEIILFLDENPKLYDLLRELHPVAQTYFPTETFVLEIVYDPEEDVDGFLTIALEATGDINEVMDAFERLRQEWWLEHRRPFGSKISFGVDFI